MAAQVFLHSRLCQPWPKLQRLASAYKSPYDGRSEYRETLCFSILHVALCFNYFLSSSFISISCPFLYLSILVLNLTSTLSHSTRDSHRILSFFFVDLRLVFPASDQLSSLSSLLRPFLLEGQNRRRFPFARLQRECRR